MRKFIILAVLALGACASVVPQDNTQRLIVAEWSVTGAANAIADLKPVLSASDYSNAVMVVRKASVVLDCAEDRAGVKVSGFDSKQCLTFNAPDTVEGYLALANRLLLEASAYYAAKGE